MKYHAIQLPVSSFTYKYCGLVFIQTSKIIVEIRLLILVQKLNETFFFLQTGTLKANPGFVAIQLNPTAYNFGLSECNWVNMDTCGMSEAQTKHHTCKIID